MRMAHEAAGEVHACIRRAQGWPVHAERGQDGARSRDGVRAVKDIVVARAASEPKMRAELSASEGNKTADGGANRDTRDRAAVDLGGGAGARRDALGGPLRGWGHPLVSCW